MKLTVIASAAALTLSGAFAYAQSGVPSGRGSATGDTAASLRPRHVADHGEFDEAEPERKRHVHLRRFRCQRRPGQGQDAR